MEDATGVTAMKREGRGEIDRGKGKVGRGMREGGNGSVGERELKEPTLTDEGAHT